jgi:hypothetical protein
LRRERIELIVGGRRIDEPRDLDVIVHMVGAMKTRMVTLDWQTGADGWHLPMIHASCVTRHSVSISNRRQTMDSTSIIVDITVRG